MMIIPLGLSMAAPILAVEEVGPAQTRTRVAPNS